ncbi:MAG TPA: WecB/TagA/CpsF family glycosyltransferase [Bryobacteraceae bacterium]|nr:WecB/TagA/CpsF family glycosyltransferase [Bryobacteraceae bacterium]
MSAAPKQLVICTAISAVNYGDVCEQTAQWIDAAREAMERGGEPSGRYVCVTSVHGIVSARQDPRFSRILNEADLATPDGMPVVWAMRSFGWRGQQRVYGPTLMLRLCEQAARRRHRVFLYGATPDVLAKLASNLTARFPELQIAGMYAPPFRPLTAEEDAGIVSSIRASRADIVFVGISTPKQEAWMSAHRTSLPGVVMFGVGAAFNFHAGAVRQAPGWMQSHGLEWLFRLFAEPRRLWRRYLLQTPVFLPLWFLQLAGWRRNEVL